MFNPARLVVVMGVSGCGKSTVGAALAARLGVEFLDGDGYHPPENKEKMRQGIPLNDADRWPWLATLMRAAVVSANTNGTAIIACSALKRAYRDYMTAQAGEPVCFLHLAGTKEIILARLSKRHHEYMPVSLLDSQFATLENAAPDENMADIQIDRTADAIVGQALQLLGKTSN